LVIVPLKKKRESGEGRTEEGAAFIKAIDVGSIDDQRRSSDQKGGKELAQLGRISGG